MCHTVQLQRVMTFQPERSLLRKGGSTFSFASSGSGSELQLVPEGHSEGEKVIVSIADETDAEPAKPAVAVAPQSAGVPNADALQPKPEPVQKRPRLLLSKPKART